jgi:3-methyladenine DNA glycosylase AlkD
MKSKPTALKTPLLADLKRELVKSGSREYAKTAAYFFKTGPGQYGEGDQFLGIRTPQLKTILKRYTDLPLKDVRTLLLSGIHEERVSGASILVTKYRSKDSDDTQKKIIYDFYMKHAQRFNNWDLVDLSAPLIPGDYLFKRDRKILFDFAHSKNLWEKRIAIMSTFGFLKRGDFSTTFEIADILMSDKHDLIHKAVGWMIREVGNRDLKAEEQYLSTRYTTMPRTMLRYAIEKFPEAKRKHYMKKPDGGNR